MVYNQGDTSIEEVIKDFKKIYSKIGKGDALFFNGYSLDSMRRLDNMLMVFDDDIHIAHVEGSMYVIDSSPRNEGYDKGEIT